MALLRNMKVLLQIIPSEKSHRNTDEQVSYTSCWPVSQMWQYFCLKKFFRVHFNRSKLQTSKSFPSSKTFYSSKTDTFSFQSSIGILREWHGLLEGSQPLPHEEKLCHNAFNDGLTCQSCIYTGRNEL